MTSVDLKLQPEFFESDDNLIKWLGSCLQRGNLRLVLGAGASQACGLPDWNALVQKLAERAGVEPLGNDDARKATWLQRNAFKNDDVDFARAVRDALYADYDMSLEALSRHRLMIAMGALAMPARRGSIREIITFNFDDLLENYLHHLGFSVKSTCVLPRWSERPDVEVLHVHGFLSSNPGQEVSRGIVFTEGDFDRIVGDRRDAWRKKMEDIFRSNVCVFLGISGEDPNLRSILTDIPELHVSVGESKFWGVRFSSNENDPRKEDFEKDFSVKQVTIPHAEIPEWLLRVAQASLGAAYAHP